MVMGTIFLKHNKRNKNMNMLLKNKIKGFSRW